MAAYRIRCLFLFVCWHALSGCGHFGGESAYLWPLVEQWVLPIATSEGTSAVPAAAAPTMSPPNGTYSSDQNVTLTSATAGADIHFTTDGSDPDGSAALYSAPIPVAGDGTSMTVRAIAIKSGMTNSAIVTSAYTINYSQVSTPAMSPVGGTYNADQSITITCATGGAAIRYTTDGSSPNGTSALYAGPIPIAGHGTNTTIKAIAILGGMSDSTIRSEAYSIQYDQVATPTMSPAGGTYNSDQSVTLSTATGGATIRYTTDGSAPDGSSDVYVGPIPVAGHGTNMTIKAIATKGGMLDSAIATNAYSINYDQVSTPTMSPAGGTYNSDQSVTLSTATGGATIRYTTDGSVPNGTSDVYVGPVPVTGTGTHTIKAIAFKAGMLDSAVATEAYQINDILAPTPGNSGTITTASVASTSLTLNWTAASDDYTTAANLEYRVYRSASNNISTPAAAQGSGTLVQDWTANINTVNVTGLTASTTYYFNVIVRDQASPNNEAAYVTVSATTAAAAVAPTDYVAWYTFSGDFTDSSGNGLELFSTDPPIATSDRGATASKAYAFDSAMVRFLGLSTSSLDFSSEVSFSYWVKVADPAVSGKHICKTDNAMGYCLGHDAGRLWVQFWDTNYDQYSSNTVTLTANTWTHVAVTVKSGGGGRIRVYRDGAFQVEVPWGDTHPLGTTPNPFYIGTNGWNNDDFLTGTIDDIRIYGRELNAGEVSALYGLPPD